MHTDYQKLSTWIPRLWKEQFAPLFSEGLIVTPFPLIDEILDKLPVDWTDPTLTVLDPCCGSGRFLLAIKYRLLDAGHSEQHIIENMIHGCDVDPVNMAGAVDMLGAKTYNHNIKCANSLTEKWTMKFDVVIGNPPYQAELKTLQQRLWMQFVDKAFELVVDRGYVCMVTPSNWATTPDLYTRWFVCHNPTYINLEECGKHFPGIGISFSSYIIQNTEYSGNDVSFTDTNGSYHGRLPARFGANERTISILTKVLESPHPKLSKAVAPHTHYSYRKAGKVSDVQTGEYTVPVLASPKTSKKDANYVWGRGICPKQIGPRVIGYTFPGTWKDMVVSSDLQTVHNFIHIPAHTMVEAEHLRITLTSKLFLFVVYQTNSPRGIKTATIQQLPLLDLTRSWTDAELYAHFNLTQEEIDLIESTVK